MGRPAADETLIGYYAAGPEQFVLILSKDGVTAKHLGPLDLEKAVRRFPEALTDPVSADHLGRPGRAAVPDSIAAGPVLREWG